MKFSEKRVLQEMAKGKAVSFDVFATALQRKLTDPRHVFQFMESAGKGWAELPEFAEARISAELEAKLRARQIDVSRQITLADIYQVLADRHKLSPDQAAQWQNLEIETEKRFIYAHPLFLRLYRQARAMGLRVFFLSDMYLSSAVLQEMLEYNGYEEAQVFVSAEQGGNKISGRLYRVIQKKLKLAPADILHFGDHFRADYVRARLSGWRAIHSESWNGDEFIEPLVRKLPRGKSLCITSSLCLGLLRRKSLPGAEGGAEFPDFWKDFGYRVVGPVYFGFLHWLSLQAERDGIHRLLLSARDGYPLLRGFEILREKWGVRFETHYFYASRRLFNLARVRDLTPANIEFLLMPNPGLKVRDFPLRLGFDPNAHEQALLALGFSSMDQQIVHSGFGRFIEPVYKKWLEQWLTSCRKELLERAQEERMLVEEYFDEVRPCDPGTVVVDIGWQAGVCKAILELARTKKADIKAQAYFLGTFPQARSFIEAGGQLKSFLFHLGTPTKLKNLVAMCEGLVEFLFCAPHGSIIGLKRGEAGVEPIHGYCEYDEQQLQNLERMREGAYSFIGEMASLITDYRNFEPPVDLVGATLTQLLSGSTPEQARNLGQIPYRVSYGEGGEVRPFAAVAFRGEGWWSNLVRYEKAPWKQGFLAQQNFPGRGILRMTHWTRAIYVAVTSKTLLASIRWALFKQ